MRVGFIRTCELDNEVLWFFEVPAGSVVNINPTGDGSGAKVRKFLEIQWHAVFHHTGFLLGSRPMDASPGSLLPVLAEHMLAPPVCRGRKRPVLALAGNPEEHTGAVVPFSPFPCFLRQGIIPWQSCAPLFSSRFVLSRFAGLTWGMRADARA